MGWILSGIFLFLALATVQADRILVVIMFGSKSHKGCFEPLLHELAGRGHNITILSSYRPAHAVPNVREIHGPDLAEILTLLPNPFQLRMEGKALVAFDIGDSLEKICRKYYESPEVRALLQEDFDLIMMNAFMGECSYALLGHFRSKFMIISSMPAPFWVAGTFGAPTLPAINSLLFYPYSDRMSFLQRVHNFIGHVHTYYRYKYEFVPWMESVYWEYFPEVPAVAVIEKNASLMLINSHPSMNFPRPLFPDMIEIGGMHCRKAKTLPRDLQEYVEGSGEAGFIFFSMGSLLQGTKLPAEVRKAFVRAFSKLKQRVLWKFESEDMEDLPPNVRLSKWFPQQDLLGHPKIKLFITHGGLLSLQEAVYHGVPLLGIPLFADQDSNMEQAQNAGYALRMELTDITEELILENVGQILKDGKFMDRAKEVSVSFRDRPEPPLKTAVFWTEYLLRQRQAPLHLRSAGRDLNFVQFHSLDVIGAISLLTVLALYLSYALARVMVKLLRRRSVDKRSRIGTGRRKQKKA